MVQEEEQFPMQDTKFNAFFPIFETKRVNKNKVPNVENSRPHPTTTQVVKLKRVKGIVIQDCDVYIGREVNRGGWNLKRSKWANPFPVAVYGMKAISMYQDYLLNHAELMNELPELDGKTLGCWCKPQPCHGDVIVKLLTERKKKR